MWQGADCACSCGSASSLLLLGNPIGRIFHVVEHVTQHFRKSVVTKSHPFSRYAWIFIEVLVLASVGLYGQYDQVPFLPIDLLAVHRGVSFPFQDKQLDAPLVTMFSGMGFDMLDKAGPSLRRGFQRSPVGNLVPVKVPLRIALPPLPPRQA